MKYSVVEREKLISEMLPMLREVPVKLSTRRIQKWGSELLAEGTQKTESGNPIVRGQQYWVNDPVMGLVDHKKKIEKIIKSSKTESDLENQLALYLSKNAKSLEAIKSGE